MAKKQRPISVSPSPEKLNNAEEDATNVHQVQPISIHEPISSDPNPNSKSQKRPNENNNVPLSPKRTKTDAAVVVDSNSKPRSHRLWSFDDEVTILKASITQLKDKIRKLRQKFEKKSESPSFTDPHDSEIFELSKKIWGNAEAGYLNGALKKTVSDENKERENVKVVDLEKDAEIENDEEENETTSYLMKVFQLYGLDKDVIKKGIKLLGDSKRMELKKLWKEVQSAESELHVRRVELVAKHSRFIFEAFQSSNH
ncbi:putative transcription factor GeBP family [Lupinus albus]|uniref:Putative transcription factor GeBP family n=1 Tax=Lupinus albus TaxID=3870 RepID=A0A6A4P4I6_LUPAL|nr:putative transcription factor GeBP family [Lupinus albus]